MRCRRCGEDAVRGVDDGALVCHACGAIAEDGVPLVSTWSSTVNFVGTSQTARAVRSAAGHTVIDVTLHDGAVNRGHAAITRLTQYMGVSRDDARTCYHTFDRVALAWQSSERVLGGWRGPEHLPFVCGACIYVACLRVRRPVSLNAVKIAVDELFHLNVSRYRLGEAVQLVADVEHVALATEPELFVRRVCAQLDLPSPGVRSAVEVAACALLSIVRVCGLVDGRRPVALAGSAVRTVLPIVLDAATVARNPITRVAAAANVNVRTLSLRCPEFIRVLQSAVDVVHGVNPARSHSDLLMHARSILENEALLDLVCTDIRYVPPTPPAPRKQATAADQVPAVASTDAVPAARQAGSNDTSTSAAANADAPQCATQCSNDGNDGDDNLSDIDDDEIDALIRTDDQVAALQRSREWLQDVIAGKRSHASAADDEPRGARVRPS